MSLFAVFLIGFSIKLTFAVELKCAVSVECPCGNKRENVSVCVSDSSVYAETCIRLTKCESCEEGSDICSKCPEGFGGPFCTLGFSRARTPGTDLIFCPDPGISANSFRRPSMLPTCLGFKQGSRLEYSCEKGYDLEGDRILFCLVSGEWTTTAPRCTEQPTTRGTPDTFLIHCPDPGVNSNSFRLPPNTISSSQWFIQGSQLEYSCDTGYIMSGEQSLYCLASGKWTANIPRCVQKPWTPDIDEFPKDKVCEKGDHIICKDLDGGYKCMHYACPPNYIRESHYLDECTHRGYPFNVRHESLTIRYICVTLNSDKRMPELGRIDMYSVKPINNIHDEYDEFELQLRDIKAPIGVTLATKSNFELIKTDDNSRIVSLVKSIQGPQEIELDFIVYRFNIGHRPHDIHKIFIFVPKL